MSLPPPETLLLGHYGELALKGGNRARFERALRRAALRLLPPGSGAELLDARLLCRLPAGVRAEEGLAALQHCFGLVSVRQARRVPRALEFAGLRAAALEEARSAQAAGAASFKIAARRADKGFALRSPDINRELGAAVAAATGLRVDVHHPDLELGVDVRQDAFYVSGAVRPGPGGLPTGTAGRALALLSGGIDSPVAAYLAAKRGLLLSAVYFHTFPYTGEGVRQKVVDLARVLAGYTGEVRLWVGYFTDIQLAVNRRVPAPLRTLVNRRLMLRCAEALCRRERAGALVTGDALGQVASQTLEALAAVGEVATLPLLRPLVAADKSETVELARRLGTFEISVRPFDDCCTLFAPRHPRTHPTRAEVRAAEAVLDVPALVEGALAQSERLRVTPAGAEPYPPPGASGG